MTLRAAAATDSSGVTMTIFDKGVMTMTTGTSFRSPLLFVAAFNKSLRDTTPTSRFFSSTMYTEPTSSKNMVTTASYAFLSLVIAMGMDWMSPTRMAEISSISMPSVFFPV